MCVHNSIAAVLPVVYFGGQTELYHHLNILYVCVVSISAVLVPLAVVTSEPLIYVFILKVTSLREGCDKRF